MPTGIAVILIVLLGGLALVQWRVVRRSASRPARIVGTAAVVAAAVLSAAAAVGLIAGSGSFDPARVRWISAAGLTWLATVFYLVWLLLVLLVLWIVVRIVRLVRPNTVDGGRRVLRSVALVGVIAAVVVTVYGVFEAASPKITRTTVAAALPAGSSPLRIALITDVHAGPVRGRAFVQKVVDETNAQNPDVVVLAGDLIDGTVERIGEDLAPLQELRAPSGVFAVTGNHEYYADDPAKWVARWREVGVRPLINESARVEREGAAVTFVGVNDHRGKPPMAPDYDAAFAGVAADGYTVAVAHEPLQGHELASRGADLQLAGHTHGGQMWPFRNLVSLQQPAISGLETVDGMPIYTSRGAGAWGPPVRVAAPPEIALIELAPR